MRWATTAGLLMRNPIGMAGGVLMFLALFYAPCAAAAQTIDQQAIDHAMDHKTHQQVDHKVGSEISGIVDKDGIVAELRAGSHEVRVGWRFRYPPPAPITRIAVTADDRPVGLPREPVEPFPAPGQTAEILYLDDLGDPHRPTAGALSERALGLPAGVLTAHAAFGQPSPGTIFDPGLRNFGGDLVTALGRALDALAFTAADRRAILVFTDGCAEDAEAVEAIASRARDAAIPIFVVLDANSRWIDRGGIERLTKATRGAILKPADNLGPQILHTILSGAELGFPLELAPRLFWQASQAKLVATIAYGDRELALAIMIDRPLAQGWDAIVLGFKQAKAYLEAFGAGAGLMLMVGLVRVAARPKNRSSTARRVLASGVADD